MPTTDSEQWWLSICPVCKSGSRYGSESAALVRERVLEDRILAEAERIKARRKGEAKR